MFGAFVYQAFSLEYWQIVSLRNMPPRPMVMTWSRMRRLIKPMRFGERLQPSTVEVERAQEDMGTVRLRRCHAPKPLSCKTGLQD